MLVDDVLDDLFYVALSGSTAKSIANAVIFEIKLVIVFEESLPVYVIATHLVDDERLSQKAFIVDNCGRGNALTLRLHVFGDAVGRDNLTDIVGKETHKILQKCHIAYFIS